MRRRLLFALAFITSLATAACGLLLALPDATTLDRDGGGGVLSDASAEAATSNDATVVTSCGGADLSTDRANCGVCGRSCLDVPCTSGRCELRALATGKKAVAMALDQEFVYWLEDLTGLYRVAKDGGGAALVADVTTLVHALAADGVQVFWANPNHDGGPALLACPRDGCGDAGPTERPAPNAVASLAMGDDQIYLGSATDSTSSGPYEVWVVRKDGGPTELVREAGAGLLAAAPNTLVRASRDVWKGLPTSGATEEYLGVTAGTTTGLVTDGQRTAWSEGYDNGSGTVQWSNGSGAPFRVAAAQPGGVALDARHVYWTVTASDAGAGSVVACPVEGCPAAGPTVLASAIDFPATITLDTSYVYFATISDAFTATIWRVPKL